MTAAAPLFRTADDQPVASSRRGVCPSLAKPMQTGDGLLVRLRPASGGIAPDVMIRLAEAARTHGNGILEVTARGNLQIRGLKPETVQPLTEAVFATGIELATGLAVETPPLSGIDRSEVADARPLAALIRAAVADEPEPLRLAAKLSVIVDGGGVFDLDGIVADIRLKAVRAGEAVLWALSLGGTAETARPAGAFAEGDALEAVMLLLRRLHAGGTSMRGRDLDPAVLGLSCVPVPASTAVRDVRRPAGLHVLPDGEVIAGVGLPFCQVKSADLIAFASEVSRFGVDDIRLAPEHGLLVSGLDESNAEALLERARALGFITSAEDPANAIALCAGTAGCASAFYDTHALARLMIAEAPALLDGSFMLHLSGCPKGCAHPAPALLSVSGASLGYGLVVNGSASVSPAAYIAANDVTTAVKRLDRLVRTEIKAGESARACLERLGAERIAAALQQEL